MLPRYSKLRNFFKSISAIVLLTRCHFNGYSKQANKVSKKHVLNLYSFTSTQQPDAIALPHFLCWVYNILHFSVFLSFLYMSKFITDFAINMVCCKFSIIWSFWKYLCGYFIFVLLNEKIVTKNRTFVGKKRDIQIWITNTRNGNNNKQPNYLFMQKFGV